MKLRAIAIGVALTWPLGALAVDPPIGSETGGWKTAEVAGWNTDRRPEHASGAILAHIVSREHDTDSAVGGIYRYGQPARAPVELPMRNRETDVDRANPGRR